MIRRFLSAKTRLAWLCALWLIGAVAMLVVLIRPFSKTPVNLVPRSSFTQALVHDGILELRLEVLRLNNCNTVASYWLWRWAQDGLGEKHRYFVPIFNSPVTLADASPLLQDYAFAFALPPAVTPGDWFLRIKVADYCNLGALLFGPNLRTSNDIPVAVPEGRS